MQKKNLKNFKYWNPEILLLLILNKGFLDSNFSVFQSFPPWGKKRGLTKVQWRNEDMGQNMSSLQAEICRSFDFWVNFLYLRVKKILK